MRIRSLLILTTLGLTALPACAQPLPGQRIPRSDPNGAYCREYQQQVVVGGRMRDSYGTACMQPDGDWKVLPSDVQEQVQDDTAIEYIEPPRYISQPVYMVPPPVFYEPEPYYYGRSAYPYRNYGSSFSLSIGNGGYYGGRPYHRHGYGRGHGHWR
ncbi:MAG: hypothetical protein ACOYNL_00905 [Rickettsiales bacterium]